EHKAHKLLTAALHECGFNVQPNYHLPTAFRAEFGDANDGPVVCVICEYDALPEIGQACGHNLIAECGLGAAIGIKAALQSGQIKGKVVCMGTPAEEGGGGKVILIEKGAFKDVDFCIMAHPGPYDQCYPNILAVSSIEVSYRGKASHASACPWGGVNALDAAVACYNNVSMLRQQMKPEWKIHCIISNGGSVPNVIPELTVMQLGVRAPTMAELQILTAKAEACIEAAANATGCECEIKISQTYKNLLTNEVLTKLFRKHAEDLGNVKFTDGDERVDRFIASTDMGDVSHEVPSIHPIFNMGTRAGNHTVEFSRCAGLPEAQPYTLVMAKCIALTAIDVMSDAKLYQDTKEEFLSHKE
ncbi:Uncharacterised protein g11322, partial [Pycnogonum litorale]